MLTLDAIFGKPPSGDPEEEAIRKMYRQKLRFDNRGVNDVIKSAALKGGVDPSLLFSSAFQEGMNLAISKPDEISQSYLDAKVDESKFPVDGFYNYGLDWFGGDYPRLKKYLPEGFDQRFTVFKAKNEKGKEVPTAAFVDNESALLAKAAVIRDVQEQLNAYAKKKGITIAPEDMNYFTLGAYNSGIGNGKSMMDEYAKAQDKRKFIDEGETTKKEVHNNISPRLKRLSFINKLIAEDSK
jgi:hypothetical protein